MWRAAPSTTIPIVAMSLVVRLPLALLACACAGALGAPPNAQAKADGDDRVEVRAQGVCGRTSSASLRLRAEDGRIRTDLHLDTRKTGLWRVAVFHERRLVARVRVRSTRAGGGFEYRIFLPDFEGPDSVWLRAVAPRGETCSAGATVSAS